MLRQWLMPYYYQKMVPEEERRMEDSRSAWRATHPWVCQLEVQLFPLGTPGLGGETRWFGFAYWALVEK